MEHPSWQLKRKSEVLSKHIIMFYFFSDNVEDSPPQPQICSQKHEKFLAIVGIYPHAILHFNETIRPKN